MIRALWRNVTGSADERVGLTVGEVDVFFCSILLCLLQNYYTDPPPPKKKNIAIRITACFCTMAFHLHFFLAVNTHTSPCFTSFHMTENGVRENER